MILRTEHFDGLLQKIAQTMSSYSSGGLYGSTSNNSLGIKKPKKISYPKPRKRGFRVRTFSQYRSQADLQPLHKDSKRIKNPTDRITTRKMGNKQKYLGDIKDNRMLNDHLRNR